MQVSEEPLAADEQPEITSSSTEVQQTSEEQNSHETPVRSTVQPQLKEENVLQAGIHSTLLGAASKNTL